MANNIEIKDGVGASKALKTTDNGSDHTPHHNLDTSPIIGAVNETAPASDTASSGLNGRLQRVAQRITSLIALVPASLGQKAKAASFAVTLASDEDLLAYAGALGETAPASDTASSGLNGRLQRIAQRLTALIALQPASLGQTGAQTSVSAATSSTTLLAANTVRRGATVYNDSTAVLYLLLSTQTASATLFTAALAAGDYYEVPFGYTGIVNGIWVTATGSARVTEIS